MQFKVLVALVSLALPIAALPGGYPTEPEHPTDPGHPEEPEHPSNPPSGGGGFCNSGSVAYCCNGGGGFLNLGGLLSCSILSAPCNSGEVYCCYSENNQNGLININKGNCNAGYKREMKRRGLDTELTKRLSFAELNALMA